MFSVTESFLLLSVHLLNGKDSIYGAVILWKTSVICVMCHFSLIQTQSNNWEAHRSGTRKSHRVLNSTSGVEHIWGIFSTKGFKTAGIQEDKKRFFLLFLRFHGIKVKVKVVKGQQRKFWSPFFIRCECCFFKLIEMANIFFVKNTLCCLFSQNPSNMVSLLGR